MTRTDSPPIVLVGGLDDRELHSRFDGLVELGESLHSDPVGFATDVDGAMERCWRRTSLMLRERSAVLAALLLRWSSLGVRVYNALESQWRITKPYQIALLEAAGLPVAATLWTNDPARVLEFCATRSAIYKPATGGAATLCRRLALSEVAREGTR